MPDVRFPPIPKSQFNCRLPGYVCVVVPEGRGIVLIYGKDTLRLHKVTECNARR